MSLGLRLKVQWWIIAVLVSLLTVYLTSGNALSRIDNLVYDHLLRVDHQGRDKEIVLVEIDDHSLARLGRWPWARGIHADLIDGIASAAPRAIAYDTLFTEPSTPAEDGRLAAAIARSGHVFLPLFLSAPVNASTPADIVEPIADVGKAAAGIGFTDFLVDPDGVVRSALLELRTVPVRRHLMDLVHRSLLPGNAPETQGTMIPFAGRDRWRRVSAASLLEGSVPARVLHDKIVLVGVTAAGIGPRYPTPGGGTLPGLEIDAQLLRGLLDHRMIQKAGPYAQFAFALVPLWLLMLAMGPFQRMPPTLSLAIAGISVLAIAAAALLAARIWLPPGTALLALCIAHPVWGWRQLAITQQFMRRELERLQTDWSIFPREPRQPAQRPLPSTIALLTAAIADNRDMKHFIADRLDQLPDATIVTNAGGDILLANAFAKTLFGKETVRTDPPASAVSLLAQFKQTGSHAPVRFPASAADAPMAFDTLTHDGRFYAIRFAPQRSVAGNFAGWIIQFMDVSEARAAQRQRDDILELLTHDMRSPQASILAVLATAPAENIAVEEARRIRHYAERTLGLADGFVQLARAEALDYTLEDVSLGDMVIDAIDDLWPQLTAKSISVETSEIEKGLIVEVERSLITRALINILGNAIKYSPPGSRIRCTVNSEEQPGGGPAWASCAIADEGPGLAEEQKLRIFERFHRAALGVGRKTDGVGLGLSFVHTVLVRHGGQVRCESRSGQGTTFTLVLPLASS